MLNVFLRPAAVSSHTRFFWRPKAATAQAAEPGPFGSGVHTSVNQVYGWRGEMGVVHPGR
jgi:hypothetical protein